MSNMGEKKPLTIGIAGSGLGGLAAACRLAQDGHHVQVFERTQGLSIASGAIYMQSNAVRCIRRWGLEQTFQSVATEIDKTQVRNGSTNEVLLKRQYSQLTNVPSLASDRRALQQTLFEVAQRNGAIVTFGQTIVEIKETSDHAIVTCEDGQVLQLDLFIAADGIRSHLRPKILPQYDAARLTPIASLSTIFPTEIPKADLLDNELTASLVAGGDARDSLIFTGQGGYIVAKYNHARQLFNIMWSIEHESGSEEDKNPRLFDENGDPEYVREFFSSWHPVVQALAGMIKSCSRWRLARLQPLDTWSSAGRRLILLGDSAHAMMPDVAEGFSSIIEDIDVLSEMLKGSHDVQEAVQSWEQIRLPRVTRLQGISQYNHECYSRGVAPTAALTEEQKNLPMGDGDADAPFNSPPFMKWMLDYDTAQAMREIRA